MAEQILTTFVPRAENAAKTGFFVQKQPPVASLAEKSPSFCNGMTSTNSILKALQTFAAAVTEKMNQLTLGEPEEQLRTPFDNFMNGGVSAAFGLNIGCTGETPLPDRLGRPDFAIHRNQSLAGYVELKAPGAGANAKRFKGRNREQCAGFGRRFDGWRKRRHRR